MEPTTVAGRRLAENFREMCEHQTWIKPPARFISTGREAILAIEAEARAAAVAPVLEVLREWRDAKIALQTDPDSKPGNRAAFWRREADAEAALLALLSAPPLRPSGEPEPGGLDVERLVEAIRGVTDAHLWGVYAAGRSAWVGRSLFAREVAAEYARLATTPERPAGEAGTDA